MIYIEPERLTGDQWKMLVAGTTPGGWSELELAEKLLGRKWRAFSWKEGMFAISVKGKLMTVEALAIPNFGAKMRSFRDVMDRLASDYGCDTVETMCFDERLAQAMVHIRAKPVAWLVQWQVEGTGDGQQEQV